MRKRTVMLIALSLLVVFGSALPVSATTDRIEFTAEDYIAGPPLDEGIQWMRGPISHVRGLKVAYETVGPEFYSGVSVVNINIRQNMETGEGFMWGTWELMVDEDRGYHGVWVATFTGEESPAWTGHGVGRGTGDYRGYLVKFGLTQQPYGDTVTGVLFKPAD